MKEKVDAIEAAIRVRMAKEAQEKDEEEERRGPARGADAEVTGHAFWADPDTDFGPNDLE